MSYHNAEEYILRHTDPEDSLLHEVYRYSHSRLLYGQMVSGHAQGRVLSMISHMIQPRHILEIGTFTGYSALCLAEGLAEDGSLDTIEINDEVADVAASFFARSPLGKKINLHISDALTLIPHLNTMYDLIFIDGDKTQYEAYYESVLPITTPKGIILADNVLWYDKVWQSPYGMDALTLSIDRFNKRVAADTTVHQLILPIRDGLMMIHK